MPFDINGTEFNANTAYKALAGSVSQSGLVLHLNAGVNFSYPGTGTLITDVSTQDNYGTLQSATWANTAGGTFNFNGSSGYGTIPNNSSMRPTSELSVCMWVKANTNTAGWNRLFGHDPYTSGGPLIFLETGGSLIRALHFPNGSEVRCNTNYAISLSTWTFVVFTFKMGDAIRSYFNGVADTTVGLAGGSFSVNSSDQFVFGHPGASWFNGSISTLRMYTRPLSQSEITNDFNCERTRHGV